MLRLGLLTWSLLQSGMPADEIIAVVGDLTGN